MLLLSFNSFSLLASGIKNETAESVTFLAGLPKPPFIVNENGAGIQLDIIRKALTTQGVETEFEHVPLSRNILNFQRIGIDAVSILPSDFQRTNMYVSKPYITYQNVAVSLANRELEINSIDDLSGVSVAAFQKARKFLGDDFHYKVAKSSGYREVADQIKQIEMLFSGETEVIILDINIFIHYCKTHMSSVDENTFKVHYIFDEKNYSAGFKSLALKTKFDNGIEYIKESGDYQNILNKYR